MLKAWHHMLMLSQMIGRVGSRLLDDKIINRSLWAYGHSSDTVKECFTYFNDTIGLIADDFKAPCMVF